MMKRAAIVLALLMLALPAAVWANSTTIINQGGTILVSDMLGTGGLGTIGESTISSRGSVLTGFDGLTSTLGRVIFTTGALMSGSVSAGGMFSDSGSTFKVLGFGAWLKGLTPAAHGITALFSGTFDSPITWTLVSSSGNTQFYTLTGDITGVLWNGQTVNGSTTQNIEDINGKLYHGLGKITIGNTVVSTTPEPGTLALLGSGLVGIAGIFRRKFLRA